MKAITVGKTVAAVAVGLCLMAATAMAVPSTYELGGVVPGSPGNVAAQMAALNGLISLYNADSSSPITISGYTYTLAPGSYVTPTDILPAAVSNDGGVTYGSGPSTVTLNVTGYTFVTIKWGNATEAYYIKGKTGSILFVDDVNQNGASGAVRYNGTSTNRVPDGGMTLALLGTSFCGLGLFARRRK
jgi:hypothetical protein